MAHLLPLVLASPHSGADYPDEFLAASRLDPLTLRRSEDSFVDEIFAAAPGLGAPLLAARFPRAYLDVNREPWELDPAMFADALPSYVNIALAAGADGARHDRPRRRQRRGDLCPQAALRRGASADRGAVPSVSPGAAQAGARHRGGVRRLSADRLPFDAVGGQRGRRAGRRPISCSATATARPARRRSSRRRARFSPSAASRSRSTRPMPAASRPAHYGNPRRGRHALQIEINRGALHGRAPLSPQTGLVAAGARNGRA